MVPVAAVAATEEAVVAVVIVVAVVDGASVMTFRKEDVPGVIVAGFHTKEPKVEVVVVVVVATGTRGTLEMMQSGTMEVIKVAEVAMQVEAGEEIKEVATTTGTTKVVVGVEEEEGVDGKPFPKSTIIAAVP